MSTTDTRCTDFEAWAIRENYAFYSESERRVLFYGVSGTRNAIQKAWDAGMAQAATEAAKATGTAGELMSKAEIDVIVYKCRQNGNDTTYDIVNACLAARQPAPVVAVKPWKERQHLMDGVTDRLSDKECLSLAEAEIADLRAALAATNRSQP